MVKIPSSPGAAGSSGKNSETLLRHPLLMKHILWGSELTATAYSSALISRYSQFNDAHYSYTAKLQITWVRQCWGLVICLPGAVTPQWGQAVPVLPSTPVCRQLSVCWSSRGNTVNQHNYLVLWPWPCPDVTSLRSHSQFLLQQFLLPGSPVYWHKPPQNWPEFDALCICGCVQIHKWIVPISYTLCRGLGDKLKLSACHQRQENLVHGATTDRETSTTLAHHKDSYRDSAEDQMIKTWNNLKEILITDLCNTLHEPPSALDLPFAIWQIKYVENRKGLISFLHMSWSSARWVEKQHCTCWQPLQHTSRDRYIIC